MWVHTVALIGHHGDPGAPPTTLPHVLVRLAVHWVVHHALPVASCDHCGHLVGAGFRGSGVGAGGERGLFLDTMSIPHSLLEGANESNLYQFTFEGHHRTACRFLWWFGPQYY